VGAVIEDHSHSNRLYVGVMNDKNLGGFFYTDDAGKNWKQSNRGLDERDILSLQQTNDGTIIAGTNHGIFSLMTLTGAWTPASMIMGPLATPAKETPAVMEPVRKKVGAKSKTATATTKARTVAKKEKPVPELLIPNGKAPRVRSIDVSHDKWYAATNQGLFISVDHGKKWYGAAVLGEEDLIAVKAYDNGTVTLVSPRKAYLSKDDGGTWTDAGTPQYVTGVFNLAMAPDGSLWMSTREGALHSTDGGSTWIHTLGGLPTRDVVSVNYDPVGQRLLATVLKEHVVYESKDGGQTWKGTPDTGLTIRTAMSYQGRLLLTSTYNGLLLEQGANAAVASDSGHGVQTSSSSQQ
jgi:photosystem II stability/assembly factor-like uncharacterized protein